jgi:hypothetical protein
MVKKTFAQEQKMPENSEIPPPSPLWLAISLHKILLGNEK